MENRMKCHEVGWFRNGQLWSETEYKNGIKHGMSRNWRENGQLFYEEEYKHGIKHGMSRNWHENGQLQCETEYKKWKPRWNGSGMVQKWSTPV